MLNSSDQANHLFYFLFFFTVCLNVTSVDTQNVRTLIILLQLKCYDYFLLSLSVVLILLSIVSIGSAIYCFCGWTALHQRDILRYVSCYGYGTVFVFKLKIGEMWPSSHSVSHLWNMLSFSTDEKPQPFCFEYDNPGPVYLCIIFYNTTFTETQVSSCIKLRVLVQAEMFIPLDCFTLSRPANTLREKNIFS